MTLKVKISKKLIPYKTAISFLEKRVDLLKKGKNNDLLWILEHPLTFTQGIRSKDNEILDKKIKITKTKRGGKITLHNPGQKVVYIALDLNSKKKDIRNLIQKIELSIIEFLKLYKINAKADKKNIGVWVKKKKIAAIGLRVTRWIAYHGCSINIDNNLDYYKKIIPCGLDNNKITSVKKESNIIIQNIEVKLKNIFLKNLKNI
ncbi:lipoyl(octanoyl) transferase LipB [Pelagibacteraceae bacterium]|jgi:lipoyl(octanoyl) transferase|nr:lipoyl(octanoyl) transferase LipB [Pelagibacteraceae bacterium]